MGKKVRASVLAFSCVLGSLWWQTNGASGDVTSERDGAPWSVEIDTLTHQYSSDAVSYTVELADALSVSKVSALSWDLDFDRGPYHGLDGCVSIARQGDALTGGVGPGPCGRPAVLTAAPARSELNRFTIQFPLQALRQAGLSGDTYRYVVRMAVDCPPPEETCGGFSHVAGPVTHDLTATGPTTHQRAPNRSIADTGQADALPPDAGAPTTENLEASEAAAPRESAAATLSEARQDSRTAGGSSVGTASVAQPAADAALPSAAPPDGGAARVLAATVAQPCDESGLDGDTTGGSGTCAGPGGAVGAPTPQAPLQPPQGPVDPEDLLGMGSPPPENPGMPTTGGSIDGLLTVASWAMGLGVLLVALARSPSRRACQLSPLPAGDSISTPSTTGPPRVAEGPEAGGVTASTSPPRSCEGPYAALYEQLLDHRAELARKLAELHSTSGVAAGPSALGD